MGRVLAFISISLDGFIEGVDRRIDWHRVDEELHQHFNDELSTTGAFLDGRVTYELMASFWPTADADPDSTPATVEFARIWRAKPKVVFSRTLASAEWATRIVRGVDADEIAALRNEFAGDLVVGGADLIDAFRRLDLIDGYQIYVHPVLVGRGKRLFADADAETDLALVDTRRFGNGVVLLKYARR